MQQIISKLVEKYEHGRISRRQLITGLAALSAAAQAGPAADSTFRGVAINHTAFRVADVRRSREFYQKHFGLPVIRESENDCFLGLGKNFLTFFKNASPGLDHHCIAIENFKADSVMEELKRKGLQPRRTSERIYFPDPDGLVVQVSSTDHYA